MTNNPKSKSKFENKVLTFFLLILSIPMAAGAGILLIFLPIGWIFPPGGFGWVLNSGLYFSTSIISTILVVYSINKGSEGNLDAFMLGYITAITYNILLFTKVIPFLN